MEPFIGMISVFGFNFAPRGWVFCQGQLLPIAQYTALFSLLGTTYGGDGRTTFGLPDFQGRAMIGQGRGPGLSDYRLGQKGGVETVTLIESQIPAHNHIMMASSDAPASALAQGASLATQQRGSTTMPNIYASGASNPVNMGSATNQAGSSQPHNNMQPYLAINYSIALTGLYPSRS